MVQRPILIAALAGVEIALAVMMVQAIHPGPRGTWHETAQHQFHGSSGHTTSGAANYAFTTGAQATVTVDIGYADLTIERRDTPGITVDIQKHGWHGWGSAPSIAASQQGDRVNVIADAQSFTWSDDRMITIAVPPETKLVVRNAGNIRATGLRADATFNSINGWIVIEDFDAPSLQVASSNGKLTLRNIVATHVNATSSNGRVDGSALTVRDGRVASSNGRVTLGFARGSDTTVTAASSNGNVRLSGFTAIDTPKVQPADDDADGDVPSAKTVRIGAGSGRLDVHSSNGNINLSQEG